MKFFSAALLALPFALQAQQVQNVKAVQTNEEVIVTYDLVDTKPAYVSLYYSKDGGTTFSPELRQVTGDIREKVRPGNSKKVSWAAAKELVAFDGDLVFKVEASRTKVGYPKPDADGYFSVEAINAYFEGTNLKIEFKMTNISEGPALKAQLVGGLVLDDQGSAIGKPEIKITDIGVNETIEFIKDVGFKGTITVKNVTQELPSVSLVRLLFNVQKFLGGITDFKRPLEKNNQELEDLINKRFVVESVKLSLYESRIYAIKNIPISK